MVEERLLDYVRNAFQRGFFSEDISRLLKKYGYSRRDADEAIWVVSREIREREESKEQKSKKKKPEKKKAEKPGMPVLPEIGLLPEMPEHLKLQKFEPIPEIESSTQERIEQKFFPEKERKKHWIMVIIEIIAGIILFIAVGILMYIYLWPAVLNVR